MLKDTLNTVIATYR